MKSRLLIIIGIVIAVSSLFTIAYFTNEGLDVERCNNDIVYKDFTGEIVLREKCVFPFTGITITDTFLGCEEGFKQVNETCITTKLVEHDGFFDPGGTLVLDDSLQKILDSCSGKFGIAEKGIAKKTLWINETHKILAETCELEKRSNSVVTLDRTVYTTPFGYHPRDTTGNYDHCFSYKTDPEYGVLIQNFTHTLNMDNCEWELENEN